MATPSFFPEPRPVDYDPDVVPEELYSSWDGPPQRIRPGVADLVVELGRSDSTVIAVQGAEVYGTGVVFDLVVHPRERGQEALRRFYAALSLHHGRGQLDMALPPGGLRWGVEFADGRKVTTLDESVWNERPDGVEPGEWEPDHPVMDGMGKAASSWWCWRRGIWLWPLPPLPTLRFVCAWPDRGIRETSVEIGTELLHRASARATPLW